MAITTIYRDQFGADVPPSTNPITYVQWDSTDPIFDQDITTADMIWDNVQYHYSPYTDVGNPPNVVYFSHGRIAVYGPSTGLPHILTARVTTASGVVYFDAGGAGVLVSPSGPDTFGGLSPSLLLSSDFVGPVATLALSTTVTFDLGGRGTPIVVPTARQWALQKAALQKAALRPRREEHE